MITYLLRFFYSINVKIFLWFWLVIVSSVFMTYIITLQFSESTSIYSPNSYSLKTLKRTKKQLLKHELVDIKKFQKEFYQKHNQRLIFKHAKTNEIHIPDTLQWQKVKSYIIENEFVNQASVEFSNTRITGPKKVILNKQNYLMFIATDSISQKLHFFMYQFPLWVRVIVLIFISFLLCWFLARNISKPMINIQNTAIRFGKGDLSLRLSNETQRRDELGALANSFNTMARQLENNIHAHQRLLGDVSHELRSPLTRLQIALALVEKCQNDSSEQNKHLARCEKELDCLDNMISDVLTLSRLEHAAQKIDPEDFDLQTLIAAIIDDGQYLANAKDINISITEQEAALCYADKKLVGSAISNILNNAVKYSPEHSNISVSLKIINYTIYLSISDQGPGVPEETLPQLFKAFYRVADDRDRKSGGTGLGLAIAQQAIQLHQGKIYAKNNPDIGLTVYIELPTKIG